MEEWKDIEGYEGLYRVSNYGRVHSILKDLILSNTSQRYPKVRLFKNKVPRDFNIHCLVLETFIGPRPRGMFACHTNGIRTDNRLSNLRWDTPSNNNKDKAQHGTIALGEKHSQSKLTNGQVKEIKIMLQEGITHKDIASQFNVTRGTITQINLGHNWGWLEVDTD